MNRTGALSMNILDGATIKSRHCQLDVPQRHFCEVQSRSLEFVPGLCDILKKIAHFGAPLTPGEHQEQDGRWFVAALVGLLSYCGR